MSWQIIIGPLAEQDLLAARQWYNSKKPGLGDEFLAVVRKTIKQLQGEPMRFPVYYRKLRRLMTRRFPYKIFYRVEGHEVIVFRILHSKQNHQRLL